MENEIMRDPSNTNAWRVYSDYLLTQAEVHGDLIVHGLEIEQAVDRATRETLQARYDALFEPFKAQWLGDALMASNHPDILRLEWRYGFVMTARIAHVYEFKGPGTLNLLRKVLSEPVGQFIQSLTLGITDGLDEGEGSYSDYIDEIRQAAGRAGLKHLVLGDFGAEECEISWSVVGNCEPLYAACPNLETLRIHGGGIELGVLEHDALKRLTIETGGLSAQAVRSVAGARLPALEYLEVWFGADDYGAEGDITLLAPLFAGKGFPALKHLGLMNCEFENEIAQAIVKAPLVSQLDSLDLSMGVMTDTGADALIVHAAALDHLTRLNVDENFISLDKQRELKRVFGTKIIIGEQDEPDDDEYMYVSVGE